MAADQKNVRGRKYEGGNGEITEDQVVIDERDYGSIGQGDRSKGKGDINRPWQEIQKVNAQLRRSTMDESTKQLRRKCLRILGGVWSNKNGKVQL